MCARFNSIADTVRGGLLTNTQGETGADTHTHTAMQLHRNVGIEAHENVVSAGR